MLGTGALIFMFVVLSVSSPALAQPWYAGNTRSLGAGVKADIGTPSTQPTVSNGAIANWVSNSDVHDGASDWVQVGWVQGDGVFKTRDGVPPP